MRYHDFETMPIIIEVRDIADTLQIGRNRAYDLIHSGEIRAVKVGNHYRIPRAAFVQFLMGNSEEAA